MYDQNKKIEKLVNTSTYTEDGDNITSNVYDGCYYVGSIVDGDTKDSTYKDKISEIHRTQLEKYQRLFITTLYQYIY
jgi:hypothetical protein